MFLWLGKFVPSTRLKVQNDAYLVKSNSQEPFCALTILLQIPMTNTKKNYQPNSCNACKINDTNLMAWGEILKCFLSVFVMSLIISWLAWILSTLVSSLCNIGNIFKLWGFYLLGQLWQCEFPTALEIGLHSTVL